MPPKKATAPIANKEARISSFFNRQAARQAQAPPPPVPKAPSPTPPSSDADTATPPPPDETEWMEWTATETKTGKDEQDKQLDEITEAAPLPQAPVTSWVGLTAAAHSAGGQETSTQSGLVPLDPTPVASTSNPPSAVGVVATLKNSPVPLLHKVDSDKMIWIDSPKAIEESEIFFQAKNGKIHWNYPAHLEASPINHSKRLLWRHHNMPELQDPTTSICSLCWKNKSCITEIPISVCKTVLKKLQRCCVHHGGQYIEDKKRRAPKDKAKKEEKRAREDAEASSSTQVVKRRKTVDKKDGLVPNGSAAFHAVLAAMNKASSKGYMTDKKIRLCRKALEDIA